MKKFLGVWAVAIVLVSIGMQAHAAAPEVCHITRMGVSLLDTDCDDIPDKDESGRAEDNCPLVPNGDCIAGDAKCEIDGVPGLTLRERAAGDQRDWDGNNVGDACDDYDHDGVMDWEDVCPEAANPKDASGHQDAGVCTDTDIDGYSDVVDDCRTTYDPDQTDTDDDGVGDACDNCVFAANADQLDSNDDGHGDACTEDADGDGTDDVDDNCPDVANVDQRDVDHDGVGDACESTSTSESPKTNPAPVANGTGQGCSLMTTDATGMRTILAAFCGIVALALLADLRLRKRGI